MAYGDRGTDRPITPVIIGVLIAVTTLIGGGVYIFVFAHIPGGILFQLVIAFGTAAFIAAVVVVVRARLKEIREEDPDDYRKY